MLSWVVISSTCAVVLIVMLLGCLPKCLEEVVFALKIRNLHFQLNILMRELQALLLALQQLLAQLLHLAVLLPRLLLKPLRFPEQLVELRVQLLKNGLVLHDRVVQLTHVLLRLGHRILDLDSTFGRASKGRWR